MFIDKVKIYAKSGFGGNGCISFRREKYVPLGGPNGGNGGKGGDVYIQANNKLKTLLDLFSHPHYKSENGRHGLGKDKQGGKGEDLIIFVPCGTVIYKLTSGSSGVEEKELISDLVEDGNKIKVCTGGRGGRGNASFKTAKNIAPRIAEKGAPGEEVALIFELKLIADVGLVGYPNAGKSTFLSIVSSAHPKIADYPFTTLTPNLGVVRVGDESIVIADIPGLIEGAHKGVGLGDKFLRHIERTRILVHIVDINGFNDKSPYDMFTIADKELKLYSKKLAKKKKIIVVNKMDLPDAEEKLKEFRKKLPKYKIYSMSAVTKKGVQEILYEISKVLKKMGPEKHKEITVVKKYIYEMPFTIKKVSSGFIVYGKKIETMAAMTDINSEEGLRRLQNILKKMGVEAVLDSKGVKEGDLIKIGEYEFIYKKESIF